MLVGPDRGPSETMGRRVDGATSLASSKSAAGALSLSIWIERCLRTGIWKGNRTVSLSLANRVGNKIGQMNSLIAHRTTSAQPLYQLSHILFPSFPVVSGLLQRVWAGYISSYPESFNSSALSRVS